MKYLISIFSFALLGITLSGCGGGGGGNNDNDTSNTDTDVVITEPEQSNNTLVGIANQSVNSVATEPDSGSQLSNDINALFGNANAEPIDIADDESLSAIINRVQNR